MKFTLDQNLTYGVCVNDILYHLSNKNPKTNFGYYFVIEQIGEAGCTIKSVRDKSYYEGYSPCRSDIAMNFGLNYISNVKNTMGYHDDNEGNVFQDEIEMYWQVTDNDARESNETLREIFYPFREKNKFHLGYSSLSFNSKCTDLSKYIVETSERLIDEQPELIHTDLNNFIHQNLEREFDEKEDLNKESIRKNAEPVNEPLDDDDPDFENDEL